MHVYKPNGMALVSHQNKEDVACVWDIDFWNLAPIVYFVAHLPFLWE